MLGLSIVFAATVIVYIQQARGWVVGFSVPVVLMVTALTLFLLGSPFYLKAAADRSAILGLARRQLQEPPRAHAAGDGRRLELPQQGRRQPRTPTNKLKVWYTIAQF